MERMDCSLQECGQEIVGTVVILQDEAREIEWADAGFGTYRGRTEEGEETEWVMLHQACFANLLEELYKSERQVSFNLTIADVPVIREALGM